MHCSEVAPLSLNLAVHLSIARQVQWYKAQDFRANLPRVGRNALFILLYVLRLPNEVVHVFVILIPLATQNHEGPA